jgi:hypothetical protein
MAPTVAVQQNPNNGLGRKAGNTGRKAVATQTVHNKAPSPRPEETRIKVEYLTTPLSELGSASPWSVDSIQDFASSLSNNDQIIDQTEDSTAPANADLSTNPSNTGPEISDENNPYFDPSGLGISQNDDQDQVQQDDPDTQGVDDICADTDDNNDNDDDGDNDNFDDAANALDESLAKGIEHTERRPTGPHRKLTNTQIKANEKIVRSYSLYAQAWLDGNEYGYRQHENQIALYEDMRAYLESELHAMLETHSGHVSKGWRLKFWATMTGCAGLLPGGKLVVGAIARQRTKRIICDRFGLEAIRRPKDLKAMAKAKKQAEKKAKKDKKTEDRNKKIEEGVKFVAKKVASTAASNAVDGAKNMAAQAVSTTVSDVVGEVTTGAAGEIASDSAAEALADTVDEFEDEIVQDLISEVFFSSIGELIHFVPMIGQAYSVKKGYSKTSKVCRTAIENAVETAKNDHIKTMIPDTIKR